MTRLAFQRLFDSSPKEILRGLRRSLRLPGGRSPNERAAGSAAAELADRFLAYQTSSLKGISSQEFAHHIRSRIGQIDANSEGYSQDEIEAQRDLSVKFHWGHNHDFGEFALEGAMQNRHIDVLATFVALFPVSLTDFQNKEVLDVGCWTGGTTLVLASLGSRVLAIEEVKKYAEMTSFLARSFDLQSIVTVAPVSIYECDSPQFYDRFDIAYFPGVVYHLSDPLLALRILFNSLRVGGILLMESAGLDRAEPFVRFDGSLVHTSGTRERLNRSGWNWFVPSPAALKRMTREAGFEEVDTRWHEPSSRVYGYARKTSQTAICRAGLSMPTIR